MGWKVLAVFVGLVTDIGISLVLGLGLGLALSFYLIAHGVAMHDLVPKVTTLTQTTPLLLAGAGLGSLGSLIGGFVTGWIAGSQRVVCGAIMAVCSVLARHPILVR